MIRTRAAAVRDATEKARRAASEKASKAESEKESSEEPEHDTTGEAASKAQTETEVDSPEMTMTVEEWSTEPVFETCSVCAGPTDISDYCRACRKFNSCVDCEDSAIASRHYAGEGCVYLEQWRRLGEPRAK